MGLNLEGELTGYTTRCLQVCELSLCHLDVLGTLVVVDLFVSSLLGVGYLLLKPRSHHRANDFKEVVAVWKAPFLIIREVLRHGR